MYLNLPIFSVQNQYDGGDRSGVEVLVRGGWGGDLGVLGRRNT
jgi:hypothetical protein